MGKCLTYSEDLYRVPGVMSQRIYHWEEEGAGHDLMVVDPADRGRGH